ncbi:MAG: hypothetical protein ACYCYF_07575 [Anaerolineae bacterium]
MTVDLSTSAWQGLAAGAVYLLAWVAGVLLPAAVGRGLARRDTPWARRVLASRAWGYLARILGLAFSLGYLYQALVASYLDPYVIGLWPANWTELVAWLPAVAGVSSLWCGLLWGVYWSRFKCREDHSPWQAYGTPLGTPAHVLSLEIQSSILRGSLIPVTGAYWGPWAACAARALVALVNPSVRTRLRNSQARAFLYLDLSVDLVAAGCFAVSGNLWVSLAVRAAAHITAGIVHRVLLHRGNRSACLPSIIEQRHGSSGPHL